METDVEIVQGAAETNKMIVIAVTALVIAGAAVAGKKLKSKIANRSKNTEE